MLDPRSALSESSSWASAQRFYQPICELARGGMGIVELVVRREGRFQRLYAMKRLLPVHLEDEGVRAMFLEEARVAGLARHPNIVSVLDVGEDDFGPYLIMEYIDGVTLGTLIETVAQRQTRLPVQLCLRIASQAARGLHAAHEIRGSDGRLLDLVHRDVTPANVLLGADGIVRVTDFGIAKALDHSVRTSTGILKGKFGYMSPEQLRFEPVDRRADLFALGVTLFELLAARRLYGNQRDRPAPVQILQEPPPDIGEARDDVPPEVVMLLFELLAKQPEQRPATAGEVAERLEEMVETLSIDEGKMCTTDLVEQWFGDALAQRRAYVADRIHSLGIEVPSQSQSMPRWSAPSGRRRFRKGLVFVFAGAVAASVIAAYVDQNKSSTPNMPAQSNIAEPTPQQAMAVPLPTMVAIEFVSVPTNADVWRDGVLQGSTPLTLDIPRNEVALEFKVEQRGYATVTETVVPDVDQRIRILLSPDAPPVAFDSDSIDGGVTPQVALKAAQNDRVQTTKRTRTNRKADASKSKKQPTPTKSFRRFD